MASFKSRVDDMWDNVHGDGFELEDGSFFTIPPQPKWAIEFTKHHSDAVRADLARKPRPEPIAAYRALARARDRKAVLNKYFADWSEEDEQAPQMIPYDCWVLVNEGRLEPQQIAPSGHLEGIRWLDTTPIRWDAEGAE